MGVRRVCLKLKMPALRLSVSLLLYLLLDVLVPANACFTCNISGRKKREAATGLLVSPSAVQQEGSSPLQHVTQIRLRDSPGTRWRDARRSTCFFWLRLALRLQPRLS